ncbi:hypothetical protein ACFOLC_04615 [Lysobacter cavernae]|uniref:Uncharacterized protein n=1 Tax=Lysobacter cavernae TaxID=1685901 RepID=A0ABV7RNF6_9GAMM
MKLLLISTAALLLAASAAQAQPPGPASSPGASGQDAHTTQATLTVRKSGSQNSHASGATTPAVIVLPEQNDEEAMGLLLPAVQKLLAPRDPRR